jgi:Ca2+-transporting ATPase
MSALRTLATPRVRVRRDGHTTEVSARDLVPGDVMLLEAGNLVAADGRIVSSVNLRTQEASLTGESQPVDKDAGVMTASGGDTPLAVGDQRNMVFMGTAITYGRGTALVTGTGMRTELGAIATLLQSVQREVTPLQRRLDQLGRRLALAALAIVAVIFLLGLLRGEDAQLMFLTAVSLAVAAVPEGLPAVVTIALALGAQHMLRRHALVRKLAAVETLGSVTVICSDKTGTLTENRMRAAVLDVAGRQVRLDDETLDLATWSGAPGGQETTRAGHAVDSSVALLLCGGALCNDAVASDEPVDPAHGVQAGDPTETALVTAAARAGIGKPQLESQYPRVAEVPFESERKRMTTVHALPDGSAPLADAVRDARPPSAGASTHVAFTKGAVDRLIDLASYAWVRGTAVALDDATRARIIETHDGLAGNGMRVLGVGYRLFERLPETTDAEALETDLVFIGLVGMRDPLRPEAAAAVATCASAGIRPLMITGDHPLTAAYISGQIGIADSGRVATGASLETLSREELDRVVTEVHVYARVSPAHKLRIVEALQRQGHVVAVTGDGVNDAPALKKANIGVAMGRAGSDVAKEAADMVLLDDNFATIVAAVEEGRVIYDNIRKFVRYLLTTNSGELWLMLVAPLLGMPLPLLPLQILWINLVTDGPPALTLGVEPAEQGVMHRPPHPPNESVFARGLGQHVLWVGILMGALTLGLGYWYWQAGDARWQTMVFTTLAFAQMAHVMAIRSETQSTFQIGLLSNGWLAAAVATTLVLQLGVVYVPALNGIFDTVPLSAAGLALCALVASVVFMAVEFEKWTRRRSAAGDAPDAIVRNA